MYVCLCNGITDSQIREAAENGCDSLRDLRRELGVGSQCAKCARHARQVLRDTRSALPAASSLSTGLGEVVRFWPRTA
ncbi:bacterioferritin-associated ferredoxin [Alloalcanivorax profundimaris]|uniref:Bacterioferritin-associated ferredoxin n=1 Tax=Alloalcanivorax profundimaris TaxID=2735259 RepID=A0ABS0AQ43_9GAMM|nr:bacterioferritin-associated ferredoxin [Alloalcanivorax profundimaris]MAO58754.1 (2Fe-2S)-binding protein [Alcanivorax sp.]MBM1142928.1 bacterioferritin-associated ferredoxin [Alcanivorax sp. ZXX171]MCQ6263286.1 bacterioferritin-associated ferredoxin [Alcanivorax sp. MM125-6]QJX03177.1 bacterioferritin-associated ferredoxin [Alcanivorax sp. IO_7]MBF1801297.1 bacterioferritin-associated ferredoxin [Alloalcanivorax profundimaris]